MTEGMPESRERVHPALQWANERVGCCLEVVISLFSEAVRLQSRTHLPPVQLIYRGQIAPVRVYYFFFGLQCFPQSFMLFGAFRPSRGAKILHWDPDVCHLFRVSSSLKQQSESCIYFCLGNFRGKGDLKTQSFGASLKLIEISSN